MKKILIVAAAAMAFAACKQEAPTMDMGKVNKAADSAYNAQKMEILKSHYNDCMANMGKKVDEKADSIMKSKSKM